MRRCHAQKESLHSAFSTGKGKKQDACRPKEDKPCKFEQAHGERCREDIKVEIKHFEEKKQQDLNRTPGDFLVLAVMHFHAQALQDYTAAVKCLLLLSDQDE